MDVKADEVVFVGDAVSDYQSAQAAGVTFIYFCPALHELDPEIPVDVPRMKAHSEIFEYLT
jgi:phosphoglycolate phosphatase-like HAD superfamily hydrolase